MDVLVRLNDNSLGNVEVQKIGYRFPLARADCYASDPILRQYAKEKAESFRTIRVCTRMFLSALTVSGLSYII